MTVTHPSTSVVGVRLNEMLNHYEVTWVTPSGRPGKTSVSIRKHGQEKAFERACQIREKKEAARLMTCSRC